jgi:2-keto-3-deoxy-L-rhamnonate aldolase RhmA
VRLTEINKTLIRICLDAGVTGIIFSTVETTLQARKIHELCKFPKHGGKRGLGLVRQNKWGYGGLVSAPPIIIAQIETKKGIDNLKEIHSHEFDYYMIGPYDLSASLGTPGDFDNHEYLDALKKVRQTIPNLQQLAVHIPTNVPKQIDKYREYGIIAVGMDTTILLEGYRELKNA